MKTCREDDFFQLKSVGQSRMSPKKISGFSWAVFFFGVIMTIASFSGLNPSDGQVSILLFFLISINLLFMIVQFLFTVFFTSKKMAYKFQRLQMVFLSSIAVKFSLDTYQAFLGVSEGFNSPMYIKISALLFFIGGILFLILSTFRGIKRVKIGELRKEGNGLYNFQNSKGYVSIPFIFGLSMFGGLAGRYSSELANDATVFILLIFSVLIQFATALALPEIFLLMYCKFRFESFKVKIPK
ncbi:hypothetical protein [Neobacillus sp. LXY-4]|uniref:hypothetical protein n=1 Tax=Neobacillus sp. LXY-4 TaxID=3379826 RepID=UPI003EE38EBC